MISLFFIRAFNDVIRVHFEYYTSTSRCTRAYVLMCIKKYTTSNVAGKRIIVYTDPLNLSTRLSDVKAKYKKYIATRLPSTVQTIKSILLSVSAGWKRRYSRVVPLPLTLDPDIILTAHQCASSRTDFARHFSILFTYS